MLLLFFLTLEYGTAFSHTNGLLWTVYLKSLFTGSSSCSDMFVDVADTGHISGINLVVPVMVKVYSSSFGCVSVELTVHWISHLKSYMFLVKILENVLPCPFPMRRTPPYPLHCMKASINPLSCQAIYF